MNLKRFRNQYLTKFKKKFTDPKFRKHLITIGIFLIIGITAAVVIPKVKQGAELRPSIYYIPEREDGSNALKTMKIPLDPIEMNDGTTEYGYIVSLAIALEYDSNNSDAENLFSENEIHRMKSAITKTIQSLANTENEVNKLFNNIQIEDDDSQLSELFKDEETIFLDREEELSTMLLEGINKELMIHRLILDIFIRYCEADTM